MNGELRVDYQVRMEWLGLGGAGADSTGGGSGDSGWTHFCG